MPTATGLPKAGEVWELTTNVQGKKGKPFQAVVLRRGLGEYWSLNVAVVEDGKYHQRLWVDPAYWLRVGWLKYVGPAGPDTAKRLRAFGWL